ncbi:unnamed protein product [Nesidiocoris tenuis]|uniref:MutL C-terminal dimerisation domain-containing protein n=1 Tax=Nesidiocoris tenuis TaxID=355587 RepID=A0A6H5G0C0_9HEMI|nr:unnamed protein product [Nesidiocoris tenuis]
MSGSIKAIDKTTVHRICSGQVVLSLAIAVKELVENAIDAGATCVEVKLKEYGSEMIEVCDNGAGVHPDNFEGLTLKYHTSKLREFSDLVGVETFGFRGEALSSLCALSNVSISTKHSSQDCGANLTFDHNGHIVKTLPLARQVGTSVSLANIFCTLPVRLKEFHRNIKKEFNKMLQILYAYCLVSTGIRITCVNQTKKGGRSIVLATQGNITVKENISCVFGSKQLTGLVELQKTLPSPETMEELNIGVEECSIFELEGLISSCSHGSGRSAPDRQYYFINSRPCDPSKVSKAVNDVYHKYNVHQYPFIFMNIKVTKESVDVNVTPDKRQIFINQEKALVAIVKIIEFLQMEIIGQFNLGFIVAKLDKDLFIIDQHASDEKYNFETLQKTTVITNQKLVVPQPLELTAANECILMDNLDVFKKNGFEFLIDPEAPATKKVSMTAVPLSANRVFGKADVDELLFMLQDANDQHVTCRPSGVRAMFASRACRKSVMIGTALNHKEMKRLVTQMGTIDHPWNCPHGRPTMRHLVNMELVKKVEECSAVDD